MFSLPACQAALTQSTQSVLTWHKSSTTSCGAERESPEEAQTGMQRWSFPEGLVHIAFTSCPLHARWHPRHGFPDRRLDSRWLGVIGESILIDNWGLLSLGGKTHISVLTHLKCHQKGAAFYCRCDIHVSPCFCNKKKMKDGAFSHVMIWTLQHLREEQKSCFVSNVICYFQLIFVSGLQLGEQTVKSVDNL